MWNSQDGKQCDKYELVIGQATIGGCSKEKHVRLAKLYEDDPHDSEGLAYSQTNKNENGKQVEHTGSDGYPKAATVVEILVETTRKPMGVRDP